MSDILLTIAIPTFNRAGHLSELMEALLVQWNNLIPDLQPKVEIIVSNNLSTDETKSYLDGLSAAPLVVVHNEENIGMENFMQCFAMAKGRYFWLMGDDDLPFNGLLANLLVLLQKEQPHLVYLPATPYKPHEQDRKERLVADGAVNYRDFCSRTRIELACEVTHAITFITSWVLDKNHYLDDLGGDYRALHDSMFAQVEWYGTLLARGSRFFSISGAGLIAKTNGSGGFDAVLTYTADYKRVIDVKFSSVPNIHRVMIVAGAYQVHPRLIWGLFHGNIGKYELPAPAVVKKRLAEYGKFGVYYATQIYPMMFLPKPFVYMFRVSSILIGRLMLRLYKRKALTG